MLIETIRNPKDLKLMRLDELPSLAEEIRSLLIQKASVCGGHLASNLGIVEITIALHYVFDAPGDKIIFDVSHQSYVHKMLTGRKDAFLNPENYADVTGFTNPSESEYDLFAIGHTSTSISLACGMAKARDLKCERENVIAIIGDASLDGGESFEALNYAGEMGTGLIVVVNDNDMSVPENHGALCSLLRELRRTKGTARDNYFRALGFEYYFVEDGHNIKALVDTFESVKSTDHPVVVHCCTQKGKGYSFAENNRENWHYARPFDINTGKFLSSVPRENYGAIVREHLLEKMKHDPDLVVVAASTPVCIGFDAESRKKAGKQFVDVGIAEQNAITMSAGIARRGGKPVFATNSTFLQRAYDQIEQEMCIGKCPATIILTHASVYGHSNNTHVGLYDIPLLSPIANLVYLAPTNKEEYLAMLDWSIDQQDVPVAIRVPWNGVYHTDEEPPSSYLIPKYQTVQRGKRVAILALGSFFQLGEEVAELLEKRAAIRPTLINPRFITGVDSETLDSLPIDHEVVVTLEDGIIAGGFGAKIAQYFGLSDIKVMTCGFTNQIPIRYNPSEWIEENRLTPTQIVEDIVSRLSYVVE